MHSLQEAIMEQLSKCTACGNTSAKFLLIYFGNDVMLCEECIESAYDALDVLRDRERQNKVMEERLIRKND